MSQIHSPHPTPAVPQRGQALLLGLLLLTVGALVWAALYHVSQTVATRLRLSHAADAAAVSGALVQARALNMHAYLHRSQVAHQVAMGHLAALASWAQFGEAQGRQAARGNPPASLMTLFGAQYSSAYRDAGAALGLAALAQDGGELAQAYAEHDRSVHEVLAATSAALLASWPQAQQVAVRDVLAANFRALENSHENSHEAAGAVLARAGVTWSVAIDGATPRWRAADPEGGDSAGNAGNELRALVDAAVGQYGFLAARDATVSGRTEVSDDCPDLRHQLRRRGATVLGADGRWQSFDTQSFQALRANQWIGCYYREYPMGWGLQYPDSRAAPHGFDHAVTPPTDFSRQAFWRWVHEHTDWDLRDTRRNALADSHAVAEAVRWPGRGLPGYATLADAAPLAVTVTLRQQPGGRVAMLPNFWSDLGSGTTATTTAPAPATATAPIPAVTVRRAAHTVFVHPDGEAETANLFRPLFLPYWQARLAPLP